MRKTTILAFATAALALVTVAANLVRADAGPAGKASITPMVQVHSAASLKANGFNAI
jgi:hypothetical protein